MAPESKMRANTKYTYTIDQLREVTAEQILALFMNYAWTEQHGGVKLHNYFTADSGTIVAANPRAACEKLYWMYNTGRVDGYTGRCMSVSDIVNLWDNEQELPVKTSWFCDSVGFVELNT